MTNLPPADDHPWPNSSAGIRRKPSGSHTFILVVAGFALLWIVLMWMRWELRAQWWAYQMIHAESREQREPYLTRLASIRDRSLKAVPKLLADPRPEVREGAVRVLRYCESNNAAELLLRAMSDTDRDVAAMAANTFAWRPDARALQPGLIQLIDSESESTACAAAIALGRLGGPEAEATLRARAATDETAPDLRAQAIDSLGLLGDRDAADAVRSALDDHRPIAALPQSMASAMRALATVAPQLEAQGAVIESNATADAPTVSVVAEHWLPLLDRAAHTPPASTRAE